MNRNYRVMRRNSRGHIVELGICVDERQGGGRVVSPFPIEGNTIEELRDELMCMLAALDKPILAYEYPDDELTNDMMGIGILTNPSPQVS